MMDWIKAIVIVFAITVTGMVLSEAADVCKRRAEASKACYEATKVNKNISCGANHDH
jgi:hypothetical protein